MHISRETFHKTARKPRRSLPHHSPRRGVEIGFQIDEAATGEEAIDRIGELQPDIVLLDHKLSGMSGLDLLGWIDDHNLDLVAVMTTAYASLDTAIKATKRGAYDFLPKPFTPVELKASIRKAAKHLLVQRHARKLAEERRQRPRAERQGRRLHVHGGSRQVPGGRRSLPIPRGRGEPAVILGPLSVRLRTTRLAQAGLSATSDYGRMVARFERRTSRWPTRPPADRIAVSSTG